MTRLGYAVKVNGNFLLFRDVSVPCYAIGVYDREDAMMLVSRYSTNGDECELVEVSFEL